MKLGYVIQARMGSTRLPGKVLMPIGGLPLLGHILLRLKTLTNRADVIIATSAKPLDDPIEAFAEQNQVICFRGDEENVLDRYVKCAETYALDQICRLTGDNPFYDIPALDRLIEYHLLTDCDYTHSFDALPTGAGAEVFRFGALSISLENATAPDHFEHVNEYILDNWHRFKACRLPLPLKKQYRGVSLTVDTKDDYEKACFICEQAADLCPSTDDLVAQAIRFDTTRQDRKIG